jgi:hypothetical protein
MIHPKSLGSVTFKISLQITPLNFLLLAGLGRKFRLPRGRSAKTLTTNANYNLILYLLTTTKFNKT